MLLAKTEYLPRFSLIMKGECEIIGFPSWNNSKKGIIEDERSHKNMALSSLYYHRLPLFLHTWETAAPPDDDRHGSTGFHLIRRPET